MVTAIRRQLSENLKRVKDRIQAACARAGRSADEVTLVAVTKYVGVDVIRQLVELGQLDIGESRVQELTKRAAMLHESSARLRGPSSMEEAPGPRWHMIGHLQRNKVRAVLPWVQTIHSVDSLRLAEDMDAEADRLERRIPILMQVNVSDEKTKFGVAVGAAIHLAEQIVTLKHLSLIGLMTIAPLVDDERWVRNCFARLRELLEELRHERFGSPQMRHLSMGMSHDFEWAIQEGATMVRIGSALFEGIEQFTESPEGAG